MDTNTCCVNEPKSLPKAIAKGLISINKDIPQCSDATRVVDLLTLVRCLFVVCQPAGLSMPVSFTSTLSMSGRINTYKIDPSL